jgi:hypothetical protein
MKEYKVINLNESFKLKREDDLKQIQDTINEQAKSGWELQHIVSPNDLGGCVIGVFCRDV